MSKQSTKNYLDDISSITRHAEIIVKDKPRIEYVTETMQYLNKDRSQDYYLGMLATTLPVMNYLIDTEGEVDREELISLMSDISLAVAKVAIDKKN